MFKPLASLFAGFLSIGALLAPSVALSQDDTAFADFVGGMLEGCSYSEAHEQLLGALYRHQFEGEPLVYPVVPGVEFGDLIVEGDEWSALLWVPVDATWHGLPVTKLGFEAERDNGFQLELLMFGAPIETVQKNLGSHLKQSNKRLKALDTDGMGYASRFVDQGDETLLVCDLST